MKAISTIVATILMLAITIALAGTAYLYISGALTGKISTSFSLVYSYTNTVSIRNDGIAPITSFTKVTVDGNPASYSVSAQDSSLVGYWKFDELDRTTATDSSGRGNTGTFTGETFNDGTISGATFISGKYGNALQFDGVGNYVSIGSIGALTSLTVEGWMYYTTAAIDRTVFGSTATGEGRHISLRSNGFELQPNGAVSTAWIGIPAVSANTWHHLALTWDGTTLRGYLDGVYQGSAPISGALDPAAVNTIGRQGGSGWYMPGLIDEVRIYNRTLSLAEITASMNSRYPVNRTIASYSFEEGSGNTAYDTHNVVAGKYSGGTSFDGVNDFVNAGNASSLNFPGTSPFTINAWVNILAYPGAGTWRGIVDKEYWDANGRQGYNTWLEQTGSSFVVGFERFRDGVSDYFTWNAYNDFSLNSWNMLTFVFDGSRMKIYFNGVEKNSITVSRLLLSTTWNVSIGARNQGIFSSFNGTIDEVKIYNRALTAEEISAIYTSNFGDIILPGSIADIKILSPLSTGTHTVRLCTPSMCNTAYINII